jgi:thiol-disulfide isomerase/thioredoxin
MFRIRTAAVFLAFALLTGCVDKSDQPPAGTADFTLQDVNGKSVKLSDFKGKVVLLEFWASWCPPCRASVPGLERLHKAFKDKGLAVLAVSMDSGDWDVVKAFISDYGISYTVLKGTDEVAAQYSVRTIPTLLILNKEGKITKRYLGFGSEEELERDIKAAL